MWCGNAEDLEQTQMERYTNAPQRLSSKRPRALTLLSLGSSQSEKHESSASQASVPQQKFDQSQSALCSLPLEIRRIIWGKVLSRKLLHILRVPKRLLAIECAGKEDIGPDLDTRSHGCWGITRHLDTTPGLYLYPREHHLSTPANLLPLLQTCRKIYTETISTLYEENIFDVNHLDTILYLQHSVLPQRLNQIRVLNLTWDFKYPTAISSPPYDLATWQETCDILASFADLQRLTVHLTGDNDLTTGNYWKDRWGPLLDALTRIKPASEFKVFLPWSEDECAGAAKEGRYLFELVSKVKVPVQLDELCDDSDLEVC